MSWFLLLLLLLILCLWLVLTIRKEGGPHGVAGLKKWRNLPLPDALYEQKDRFGRERQKDAVIAMPQNRA